MLNVAVLLWTIKSLEAARKEKSVARVNCMGMSSTERSVSLDEYFALHWSPKTSPVGYTRMCLPSLDPILGIYITMNIFAELRTKKWHAIDSKIHITWPLLDQVGRIMS